VERLYRDVRADDQSSIVDPSVDPERDVVYLLSQHLKLVDLSLVPWVIAVAAAAHA